MRRTATATSPRPRPGSARQGGAGQARAPAGRRVAGGRQPSPGPGSDLRHVRGGRTGSRRRRRPAVRRCPAAHRFASGSSGTRPARCGAGSPAAGTRRGPPRRPGHGGGRGIGHAGAGDSVMAVGPVVPAGTGGAAPRPARPRGPPRPARPRSRKRSFGSLAMPRAITASSAGGTPSTRLLAGGGPVVELGIHERGQVFAREGRCAGQALVQHASQGVDIGPSVNVVAGEPLRGHVVQRSDRFPGDRQRRLPAADRPGDAEVDHVNEVARGDQDVRRLDVAVDEVVGVRGIQGLGDLADKVHRPPRLDPAVRSSSAPISVPSTKRMSMKSWPSISPKS